MYKDRGIKPRLWNHPDHLEYHCNQTNAFTGCHLAFFRPNCMVPGTDPVVPCTTPEHFRQDREDAYIVGLMWSIGAGKPLRGSFLRGSIQRGLIQRGSKTKEGPTIHCAVNPSLKNLTPEMEELGNPEITHPKFII